MYESVGQEVGLTTRERGRTSIILSQLYRRFHLSMDT